MSKITNDGLTRSGTRYSRGHMATVGVKGLIMFACYENFWNAKELVDVAFTDLILLVE